MHPTRTDHGMPAADFHSPISPRLPAPHGRTPDSSVLVRGAIALLRAQCPRLERCGGPQSGADVDDRCTARARCMHIHMPAAHLRVRADASVRHIHAYMHTCKRIHTYITSGRSLIHPSIHITLHSLSAPPAAHLEGLLRKRGPPAALRVRPAAAAAAPTASGTAVAHRAVRNRPRRRRAHSMMR